MNVGSVPARGRLGTTMRAEALLSVASGESSVLDIFELAAEEPALRSLKLRDLLLARPGASSPSVSAQLKWLALQLGESSANKPVSWWRHPQSTLRMSLLRTVIVRGAPPKLGTVEGGIEVWSAG